MVVPQSLQKPTGFEGSGKSLEFDTGGILDGFCSQNGYWMNKIISMTDQLERQNKTSLKTAITSPSYKD